MNRAIMLSVGWLAATGALLYAVLRISLQWNFFDWSPKWDFKTIAEAIGVAAVLAAIWFLGKASRDKISRSVAILACLALVCLAIAWFPAEPTTQGFLGRSQPSPLWFRGGRVLVLCVPGVFWFWWIRRHLTQNGLTTLP
jgi:amino acid permease